MPSRSHGYDFDGGGGSSPHPTSSGINPFQQQFKQKKEEEEEKKDGEVPCRSCTDFKTWLKATKKNKGESQEDTEKK